MNHLTILTPKQENFCMAYIESGNASAAYRQSYLAEKMKPETVNRKATELMANGKIAARVELLQEAAKERFEISVDKKKAWLVDIIEHSVKEESWNGSEAIKAIAEVNKMDGDYAPSKTENKVFVGGGDNGKAMMNVQVNFVEPDIVKITRGRVLEHEL